MNMANLSANMGFPVPGPPAVEPAIEMTPIKSTRWQGWAKPEIIKRVLPKIIERLQYFAQFEAHKVHDDGHIWQRFELHTGKNAMSVSAVARRLGHDWPAHKEWLQLMPIKRGDNFSDRTNVQWHFENPKPVNPSSFLNRGMESNNEDNTGQGYLEIEVKNMGDENDQQITEDEWDEDEVSKKSTERMRRQEIDPVFHNKTVYNCCNWLWMTTKNNPEARY